MSFKVLNCKEFGKFHDRSFDLHETTVFFGENEAGKTTLCDAFLFALSGENSRFGIFRRYGKAKAQLLPSPRVIVDPYAALELNIIRAAEFSFVLDSKSSWQKQLQQKLFSAGINPDALIRKVKNGQRRLTVPKELIQDLDTQEQKLRELDLSIALLERKQQELATECETLEKYGIGLRAAERQKESLRIFNDLTQQHIWLTQVQSAARHKIQDLQLARIDFRQLQHCDFEVKSLNKRLQMESNSYTAEKQIYETKLRELGKLEQQLTNLPNEFKAAHKIQPTVYGAAIAAFVLAASLSLNFAGVSPVGAWLSITACVLLIILSFYLNRRHKHEYIQMADRDLQKRREAMILQVEEQKQAIQQSRSKFNDFERRSKECESLEHKLSESLSLSGFPNLEALEQAIAQATLRQKTALTAQQDLERHGHSIMNVDASLAKIEQQLKDLRKSLTLDSTALSATEGFNLTSQQLIVKELELRTQAAKLKAQAELLPAQREKQAARLQALQDQSKLLQVNLQAHELVLQVFTDMQRNADSNLEKLELIATELLRSSGIAEPRKINMSKWKNDCITALDGSGAARPIDNLSSSTQALYYLALRIAALALLDQADCFLLLDEPFAHFDKARTEQALQMLLVAQTQHRISLYFFTKDAFLANLVRESFANTLLHQLTPLPAPYATQPNSPHLA